MKRTKQFLSVFLALIMIISIIPMASINAEAAGISLAEMTARAEAIVNYTWIPSQNISTWNGNKYNGKSYFVKGETVKGVPYTLFTSEVVSKSLCSLAEYKSVASSNYSATAYCVSVPDTRTGPVYGSCCADLVCEVFGGNFMNGSTMRYHSVKAIKNSSYGTTTYNVKATNIVAGDALSNTDGDHIIWVGSVTDSKFVIYEQTPPVAQKKTVNKSSVDSNGYLVYNGDVYNIVTKSNEFAKSNTLSVYYNANGGTVTADGFTLSSGLIYKNNEKFVQTWEYNVAKENGLISPKSFGLEKTGYTFAGWGTKASGGTVFDQNDTGLLPSEINSNLKNGDCSTTLYAVWVPNELSVYYNANGGIVTADGFTLNSGLIYKNNEKFVQTWQYNVAKENGLISPKSFGLEKTGYTFAGWGTKASGGTIFDQNDTGLLPSKINSNIKNGDCSTTLYAIWVPNGLSVYYNANGGTVTADGFTLSSGLICKNNEKFVQTWEYNVAKENGLISPKSFGLEKTGYTFAGWGTKASGGTVFDQNDTGLLPSEINSNLKNGDCSTILYAIWKANTYTVNYDANGGSGTMSDSSHTYDASKSLSSNTFTREGYTFLGWSTKSSATTTTYTDGQSVKNLTTANGTTVTLYAVWQKNQLTVSSISVATKPTKTEYYVGDTFSSSGLSIKVNMSDGTTKTLTSGFAISSPDMSTAGTKTVTVAYSGKTTTFTIKVVEKTVTPDEPDTNFTFGIQEPSRTEIRNKDGIILHANIEGNAPEGSYIVWTSSNGNFDEDADENDLTVIAKNKGYTTFTATLYDVDGNVLVTDSVELYSKSGFFDKIGGFFRSLFGTTKIYEN